MPERAPMRDVVRVFEVEGPKGGMQLVHVLECGCWVIRGKQPRMRMQCIACAVKPDAARQALIHAYTLVLDDPAMTAVQHTDVRKVLLERRAELESNE